MPRSAMLTGAVDLVLPVARFPKYSPNTVGGRDWRRTIILRIG
jgi:hypothetical protein